MAGSKQDERNRKVGDAEDRAAGHIRGTAMTLSGVQGPRGHSKRAKTVSSEPTDKKKMLKLGRKMW